MPEEPDVSPEDLEILDEVWRKRSEAKKQLRAEKEINLIADRILAALQSRPDGMEWQEIRQMFDESHSDEQIRQALKTPLARTKVEKSRQHSGERFLLAS